MTDEIKTTPEPEDKKPVVDQYSPTNFNAKLAWIQGNLKVPKSRFNSFGKYNYRSAEELNLTEYNNLTETTDNPTWSERLKALSTWDIWSIEAIGDADIEEKAHTDAYKSFFEKVAEIVEV